MSDTSRSASSICTICYKKACWGEWALSTVGVEEGREFRFRGDLYSQESTFPLVINGSGTHTHLFNVSLSRTTRVSRYQKGKTNLDLTEARFNEWQWHQLGHVQVCTSLQTENHASTPPLSFYRPDALPAAQPTAPKH